MNTHDPTATPNAAFPNLTPTNHRVIGPATDRFNCIAWACGNVRQWWQPGPDFHWPVGAEPGNGSVGNLLAALVAVGYAPCPDGNPEPGAEKVAVYANGNEYTHAARLLPDGQWSSKLGAWELIEHNTPEDIAGGVYGTVFQFMKRPLTA